MISTHLKVDISDTHTSISSLGNESGISLEAEGGEAGGGVFIRGSLREGMIVCSQLILTE